jgi:HD-GYP domain-containing protein (c-di-GMP phosphodiesterase class II)
LAGHLQQPLNPRPDLVLFGLQPAAETNWENLGRVRELFAGPLLALSDQEDERAGARLRQMGVPDYLAWGAYGSAGLELKIETLVSVHRIQRQVHDHDHRVQRLFINILTVMVKILESKDYYTRFHSHSVSMWSRILGRKKGLGEEQLTRLGLAGVFHDFGKIGIPEDILTKPTRLTDEEFAIIMHHPQIARDLLSSIDLLADLLPAITHHHERWDGKGYPAGLKGEQTPLWARIIGIADAYDTMSSKRTYKEPMPIAQVEDEFRRNSGTQFDPELVTLMLAALEEKRRTGGSLTAPPVP